MAAASILGALRAQGFSVSLVGSDGLLITPSSTLGQARRELLRANKAEIVALLRDAKATVAGCTPQQMQHATFKANAATDHATTAQQIALNPHGIWVSGATDYATGVQQVNKTTATKVEKGEKLQVAFASTCNTQPGSLTAHRVTADLLKAAMLACDHWGDSPADRELMRADCLAMPDDLKADLLAHFRKTYGKGAALWV